MIDDGAVGASDARRLQGVADGPGVMGQRVDVVRRNALQGLDHALAAFLVDKKEPISAPGDVTDYFAVAGHVNAHGAMQAIGGHIAHADRPVVVQEGADGADRRFNAVFAGTDAGQVGQRGDQADGAVAAHPQVAGVVEEDDAGGVGRILWCAKQCAYHDIAAARFQHGGGAPGIMFGGKAVLPFGHAARAQVGKARYD
ncbi:hypothetical protein D3C72_1428500 [compost metagenome]